MLLLTKIFHFEMAHAISGYQGLCKNIHGHSYQLHVTVGAPHNETAYIAPPGFLLDFKELKQIVHKAVVAVLDHKLVLSKNYIAQHSQVTEQENLVVWEAEPTAENLLLYMQRTISRQLPAPVQLLEMKLYETPHSYASWRSGLL